MKLYHVTSIESAKIIQKNGFKAIKNGWYGRFDAKTLKPKYDEGIFFADTILGSNDGLPIEYPAIFVLEIPEEEIKEYEWFEEHKSHREWCVPEKIINNYFQNRTICHEEDFDDGNYPTE